MERQADRASPVNILIGNARNVFRDALCDIFCDVLFIFCGNLVSNLISCSSEFNDMDIHQHTVLQTNPA
jgi:hypothetical protein